ncbi:MAG: caspase family protein [Gemmataceae bacterium]
MKTRTVATVGIVAAVLACGVFAVYRAAGTPRPQQESPPATAEGDRPTSPTNPTPAGGDVFPYGRVVAVTIAIDRHPNALRACDLKRPVAEAQALGDVLSGQFGYDVHQLFGPEATKGRILDTVRKYSEELGERDALLVYFGGHGQVVELPDGTDVGYLVPWDGRVDPGNKTDAGTWADQAVEMQRLVSLVAASKVGHALFIVDACHSGFFTTTRGTLAKHHLQSLLSRPSRAALTATARDQTAKDGIFTPMLIERLRKLTPATKAEEGWPPASTT